MTQETRRREGGGAINPFRDQRTESDYNASGPIHPSQSLTTPFESSQTCFLEGHLYAWQRKDEKTLRNLGCTVKLACKVDSISIMMVAEDIRSPRSITTGVCTSSWYISQLTLEITITLWKFTDLVAAYRVNTSIIVTPLSHQCLSNSLREGNGTHVIPSRHFVV